MKKMISALLLMLIFTYGAYSQNVISEGVDITLRNTLQNPGEAEVTYASLFQQTDDAFDEFGTLLNTESEFPTALAQTGTPFGDINGLYNIDFTQTSINFTLLPDENDPFWVQQFETFPSGKFDRYYFTFSEPHNIASATSDNPSVSLRIDSDHVIVVEIGEGYDFNPGASFNIALSNQPVEIVVEVTLFDLNAGVDPEVFRARDAEIEEDFASQQPGFLKRMSGVDANGQYVVMILWETLADADASIAAFSMDPTVADYFAMIDGNTFSAERYTTFGIPDFNFDLLEDNVIEITTFNINDTVDPDAFITRDAEIEQDFSSQQPGFIRRTSGVDANDKYVVIVFWETLADADASIAAFSMDPTVADYFAMIDVNTFAADRYTIFGNDPFNEGVDITLRNTLQDPGAAEVTYPSLFGQPDDAYDEFATLSNTDIEFATALAQSGTPAGDINGLYEIDITESSIEFTALPDANDPFWTNVFGLFPEGKFDRYYFTFSEPHNITSAASNHTSVDVRVDSDHVIVVEISEGYDLKPGAGFFISLNMAEELTNEQKARGFNEGLQTGDPSALNWMRNDYIQHNLTVPTGKEGIAFFYTGQPIGLTIDINRSFEAGDYVFAQTTFGGSWGDISGSGTDQIIYDVWRFEDGFAVEHWDNIGDVIDDMDGTTQSDGVVTPVINLELTNANQALLEEMAQTLFVGGDWTNVRDYFDVDNYIQHSVGAGTDGAFLASLEGQTGVPFYESVKFVHTSGNFGLVMSQGPDITGQDPDRVYAYYDLFRIENGLIVEHWDIIEEIPPVNEWVNTNGKWGDDRILTNEEKARALQSALATGDPSALDYISDDQYTQHNLGLPDGKDALAGFYTGQSIGITVDIHRSIEVGDYVILHTTFGGSWGAISGTGSDQVVFDLWRFENGLMVEHWDNIANVMDDMDGTTQTDGAVTPATDLASTDANQLLLETMAQTLFVDGDWTDVQSYFDIDSYVQHSVGAGTDGAFLASLEGQTGVSFYEEIKFVHTLGNFGLVMSQGSDITGQDPDGIFAYYDLFRIDNGLIVEHWDVIQLIPTQDQWANTNGKWGDDAIPSIGVDLNLNLEVDNLLYEQYSTIDYVFTVTNEGDETATNVEVDVTLPEGLVYSSHNTTNSDFSLFFENWSIPTLAPGESTSLNLTLFALVEDQDITYFSQIESLDQLDADSSPGNDTNQTPDEDDEAAVTIMDNSDGGYGGGDGTADLELEVSVDNATFDNWEHLFFTITVTNNGPDAATGIVVSTPEPENNSKFGGSNPSNISNGEWSEWAEEWVIEELASGATATLTLDIFALGDEDPITFFSQVFIANELDPDSTPGNDVNQTPDEDDEAAATAEFLDLNFNSGNSSTAVLNGNDSNGFEIINLSLFPNPVTDFVTVAGQIETPQIGSIQVINIEGKTLKNYPMDFSKGYNEMTLKVSDLQNGVYILQIHGNEGIIENTRFIKLGL